VTPQKRCVFQKKSTHAIYPKGITCFFPRQKKTYDQINRLAKETVFRCKKSNGKKNGQQCNQKRNCAKQSASKNSVPRAIKYFCHIPLRENPRFKKIRRARSVRSGPRQRRCAMHHESGTARWGQRRRASTATTTRAAQTAAAPQPHRQPAQYRARR